MLELLAVSELAIDANREHRINANSFQQNAIISHNGWQYAVFYSNKNDALAGGPLLVNVSRRRVDNSTRSWETVTLRDYEQTVDDGHNTISIGICPGDGSVHLSFDHHCDQLRFRISKPGVANDPSSFPWTPSLFGPITNALPGCECPQALFSEVTYPRFLVVGEDLLLSYRIGQAGSGSDVLFKYMSESHKYVYIGQLLTGIENSPYVNGINYAEGRIHISGTYRHFIEYEGYDDPNSTRHRANAGPNGPENNYGLFYTYSDDGGFTFGNSAGQIIASLSQGGTILPDAEGLIVFDIPKNSGILNQESQAADSVGGFHVLNREKIGGKEKWMHYYRRKDGQWSKHALPRPQPTQTGSRGSVVAAGSNMLFFALPGNKDDVLTIVRAVMKEEAPVYETVWQKDGFSGEPHLDMHTQNGGNVLSLMTRTTLENGRRKVVVLDFAVNS